ncbi:hypothetical protein M404DRAFT_909117 [Pisolithus tinctorius Marx 270]|uniref:Uncharacterized protein n=1 Tax=Pisolithus tinctorius Marx 270 TaxID=870435 RepID=A0A0C3JMR7_PISTI|nr:hypothetical protein M404DRAFT_909117 [Pisolithus tinctorius Marx 270]
MVHQGPAMVCRQIPRLRHLLTICAHSLLPWGLRCQRRSQRQRFLQARLWRPRLKQQQQCQQHPQPNRGHPQPRQRNQSRLRHHNPRRTTRTKRCCRPTPAISRTCRRLPNLPTTPRANLRERVGVQGEAGFDLTSSTDKATVVTACEQNVDVTVTEGDSRDTETTADAAKEAKNETPTPTKTSEEPKDSHPTKGNGDEKSKPSEGDDDHGKDAEQEKQTNDGEDQTKNVDKEEPTKDGDDQSKDADLLGVFSDSESKGGKGNGGNRGKRGNNNRSKGRK